jgi:hypothetical protein
MGDHPISADLIRDLKNDEGLHNLIANLGYKTTPRTLYISGFDLPQSAQKLLKELQIISDYDQKFQIYFGKTTSMRRTDFRTILEPFYRQYPQINTLFIFTENWDEIAFISPERVAIEPKKVKPRLRILFIDPKNVYHTDLEILKNISISAREQTPDIIWKKHLEAFNVERVTSDFFEAYKNALKFIKDILDAQKKATVQDNHSFAQQLLSRIMFLYFVQKKGWLKWKDYVQDKRYIKNLWEYYKNCNSKKDTFYSLWLSSLFFQAFNRNHKYLTSELPEEIKESFNLMPFLNGGLFTENKLDNKGFDVPDEIFSLLFDIDPLDRKKGFLERYNFTIREDTPLEVEVAVDPEMLGKVYESLISEEERGKSGIFYTPRVEIDYMCRLSLVEYLFKETGIPKTSLIPLIFEPRRIMECSDIENLRKIREAIDNVKIVDPAVGSASFLVGMTNVLVEIINAISLKDGREENLFALKNKVLSENLYGVDVKDWAVMVGELRLWLSLVIETDEKLMDIYTHPLLPNLTFKIRQGDSLLEEVADIPISLRGRFSAIPKSIKEKITALVDRKAEYFSGRRSSDLKEKKEIEDLENEIFKDIIREEIKKLEEDKLKIEEQLSAPKAKQIEMFGFKLEQKELFEEETRKLKQKLQALKQENEHLSSLLNEIGQKSKKDYFLWEVDFAEVFALKGGFDIVIGNPPYVRQEMIAFPMEKEEDYGDAEEWRERKRKYKEKLAQAVRTHWGESVRIDKKSDLYVYFYYNGLALLRPGGVFCFVNSNSWLDVGYGSALQEFLLKKMEPVYIIDNLVKRTFAESDVNTVIVLIKRPTSPDVIVRSKTTKQSQLKFIAFKKPFEEVLKPETILKIEQTQEKLFTEDYNVFPKTKLELLEEGVEMPEGGKGELIKDPMHLLYIGNKWGGKYLRAPDIFFKILEKGKGKLVRLGDIAEVRRGFTTGANDFFYLEPTGKPAPEGFVHVRNGAGWEGLIEEEFLKPVIKSPREIKTIIIRPEDLRYRIFMCHKSKKDLKGTHALEYIKWGEKQKTKGRQKQEAGIPWSQVASIAGRAHWYSLDEKSPMNFFCNRFFNDRYFFAFAEIPNVEDQTFYGSVFQGGIIDTNLQLALLNCSISYLFIELLGRVALGEGVLQYSVYEMCSLLVLDSNSFTNIKTAILQKFDQLKTREIKSIFEEFGLPQPNPDYSNIDPNDVSLDKAMPDRLALDRIIFQALGLTEEEQLELYREVVKLVKARLVKAKSV